jgi:hypothetical protein
LAPQADAGVITIFNNRALFNTLADPNGLLTFDTVQLVPVIIDGSVPIPCIVTRNFLIDDLLVLSTFDSFPVIFGGGNVTFDRVGDLLLSGSPSVPSYLAPPMTAIGFDMTGTGPLSLQLLFPGDSSGAGSAVNYYMTITGPTFFGFIADSPFQFAMVPGTPPFFGGPLADPLILDNLAVRTVPEPSTALLFGSAFTLRKW